MFDHIATRSRDEWSSKMCDKSGFNRRIGERANAGTKNEPAIVLEVNGRPNVRHIIPRGVKEARHLIQCIVGPEAEGYEKTITYSDLNDLEDGFDTPNLKSRVEGKKLGAIVLSHLTEKVRVEVIKQFLDSAGALLFDVEGGKGGKLFFLDRMGWKGSQKEIIAMIQEFKSAVRSTEIKITRSHIGPRLSRPLSVEISQKTTVYAQYSAIKECVDDPNCRAAKVGIVPVDVDGVYHWRGIRELSGATYMPGYYSCDLFEFEVRSQQKISDEKRRNKERRAKEQRAKKLRKKEKRNKRKR